MRHNNYKYLNAGINMENKKGQVTVFIIVALVIVGIILLLLFYQRLPIIGSGGELSPETYLRSCIEPELKKDINSLAIKGGYSEPEGYLEYQGEKIKYLCYTSEFYKTCIVQQPLIKEHFEGELNSIIKSKINGCMQSLKQEYEKRGYGVSSGKVETKFSFNPGNMLISISTDFSASKGDTTANYKGFDVQIESKMYDLLMIATSIIDYESTLGDSEITAYMQYYPDLKVEKTKLSDGSKVYRVSNVVTNEEFRFATRSLSWPPGYGL